MLQIARGKVYSVEDVVITVTSFHLSWHGSDHDIIIGMNGKISKIENGSHWSAKFELNAGRKSKLVFKDALIHQKEGTPDLTSTALTVKRVLIQFVRQCPLIPEGFRERTAQIILRHHEQQSTADRDPSGARGLNQVSLR